MKNPIDPDNIELFKYVRIIIRGKGEPFQDPLKTVLIFPSEVKLIDPIEAMDIFAERYNTGQILCRYKYEDYLKNKDLQDTINGLGLDTDAF